MYVWAGLSSDVAFASPISLQNSFNILEATNNIFQIVLLFTNISFVVLRLQWAAILMQNFEVIQRF